MKNPFKQPDFQWTHNKGFGVLLSQDGYYADYSYDENGKQTITAECYHWRFEIRLLVRAAVFRFRYQSV